MRSLFAVALAAGCLLAPSLATAHDDARSPIDHVTCSDGTVLTPPLPDKLCKEHGTLASVSCADGSTLTPPFDGKKCGPVKDDKADDDAGDYADKKQDRGERHDRGDQKRFAKRFGFSAGFLNRVWRIKGSAFGYEDGVLDFTADRFMRVPRKFRHEDDALVGEDSRVLVTAKTRVYDEDGNRITGAALATTLDAADDVTVTGKLVPKASWLKDEDDVPVPTLRAKRIVLED